MTRIKKICALVLVLMLVVTVGAFSVSAAETSDNEVAADSTDTGITVYVRDDDAAQPYIYLWNSLPTNEAMSDSYPGEKLSQSGEWFTLTIPNVTKVNAIVTDADGNQYSNEKKLTTGTWYCSNGKWTSYDPDNIDSASDIDMREESIYFVITTRFYDGDTGNNVHCWDDSTAGNTDDDPAWRGDFKGLAEKLDYIKALGFTAIWITPVVTNASGYDYHGYHAMDFSTVDVRYESDDFTYQDLIDAVHAKGMKIIQDVVWQHTGNFGEEYFCKLFEKDTTADLSSLEDSMVPTDLLLDTYGLDSADDYWAQTGSVQYSQRLQLMKNTSITANNTTGTSPGEDDYSTDKLSNSDVYNANNYYHTGYFQSLNWDDWSCKYCQIAGDCVDLNTENPAVAEYTTEAYAQYIDMGVDGFRVDTVRHISRLSLNMMYNDQIMAAAAASGNSGFYMFGEVCTRAEAAWYRGHAEESAPYYTWKESNDKWAQEWSWGTSAEDVNNNMNLTFDHYAEEDDTSDEPTSDNAFLNGIEYHETDTSMASGMNVIDFAMHWTYYTASGAYNTALTYDKYYNDATWNVVYVDSHDYSPNECQNYRYTGGTQAWAENLDLMFTFRGIPCLYYGSEVEFQKGATIDVGTTAPLSTTGRAYYGDYLEGDVTATDFGEYTASGTVADTLDSTLAQHLMKLNKIRQAVPALQKGQYTASSTYVSGNMAYIRRYTDSDEGVDSLALVTISDGATFKNIPNGTYIDAVTGDVQTVTNGTLTVSNLGEANMRVYVCCADGFTGIDGQIGGTTTYLN
ncbi:MAG: starch-binding protein [Clostridiales bacterium]|nr:starch-binding protein [Clostridiales bacterium]